MRSATASHCQSSLLAFRRVYRDEGEEDHLDDQRDHRSQDAGYRIAEAPEEGREHQCGDGGEEHPIFLHHNRSHLTSDAPA